MQGEGQGDLPPGCRGKFGGNGGHVQFLSSRIHLHPDAGARDTLSERHIYVTHSSPASLALTGCSHVDMLGLRYRSVNCGAGRSPG